MKSLSILFLLALVKNDSYVLTIDQDPDVQAYQADGFAQCRESSQLPIFTGDTIRLKESQNGNIDVTPTASTNILGAAPLNNHCAVWSFDNTFFIIYDSDDGTALYTEQSPSVILNVIMVTNSGNFLWYDGSNLTYSTVVLDSANVAKVDTANPLASSIVEKFFHFSDTHTIVQTYDLSDSKVEMLLNSNLAATALATETITGEEILDIKYLNSKIYLLTATTFDQIEIDSSTYAFTKSTLFTNTGGYTKFHVSQDEIYMMFSGSTNEINYYNPDYELEETRSVQPISYMGFVREEDKLVYKATDGYIYTNLVIIAQEMQESPSGKISFIVLILIIVLISVLCLVAIIVAIYCMEKRKSQATVKQN